MKRLIIVCEGPTEQEFCREILAPYLQKKDIFVSTPTIKKSGGGITSWIPLRMQIRKHLLEGDAYVTMMVDYYGIKNGASFPGWVASLEIADKEKRIRFLQNQILLDMDEDLRGRFIPYIQLHEFEALLFSGMVAFQSVFGPKECDFDKLNAILRDYPNPEMINNNPNTAPSKRLKSAIPGYDKVLDGKELAAILGLDTIRERCPMFNDWITNLENI